MSLDSLDLFKLEVCTRYSLLSCCLMMVSQSTFPILGAEALQEGAAAFPCATGELDQSCCVFTMV